MYKLHKDYIIRLTDGSSIPLDRGNSDYAAYLAWIEEGNTPEPEVSQLELSIEAASAARDYRDAELARADIMLNRVQDGETGIGTQKAWRAYRVLLRDWPSTESFPADAPVAPDTK